ncbi:AAA family ATPase [Paenibacillus taichungensis]|uniref:AAA family ATPase n=1 Tax=Paenibacillus taichungensis TaxID=484184 RepID=UPI003818ADA9
MQRITIHNFGPVPSCELDIQSFMILIGEQSTGKSTICKCVYFFKSIRDEVKSHLYRILTAGPTTEKKFPGSLKAELKSRFIELFGMSKFKGDFFLKYEYAPGLNLEITTTNDKHRYLDFNFSQSMILQIQNLEEQAARHYYEITKVKEESLKDFFNLERGRLFKSLETEVHKVFYDEKDHHYIPAGRGLLTLLTNQLLNIELKSLDYITRDFLKLIQSERSRFELSLSNLISSSTDPEFLKKHDVQQKVASILKGHYYLRGEKEYIKPLQNRSSLPINYASSGQQEVLWILNLLLLWLLDNKKAFVIIEEPEAHLFPNAQKEVIDFIALFANASDSQIMITTHSPYVLTSANNLFYAGRIGEQQQAGVDSIISKDYWIKPDSFSAYMVGDSKDNHIKSIVDDELQEIAAEHIDNISTLIRTQYSKIFELEAENEFFD